MVEILLAGQETGIWKWHVHLQAWPNSPDSFPGKLSCKPIKRRAFNEPRNQEMEATKRISEDQTSWPSWGAVTNVLYRCREGWDLDRTAI